ncbi:MAG TPA: LamG domain-containing protein, partial [Gemmataceae bacterium]|nr:LamG domain-containing protein [Gemmataceae bacterium]
EVGPGPGAAQAAAPPNRPAPAGLPGPSRPAGPVGYDRSQDRPDGLVGHWRFDSPVTQEAKDLSGLEQTAILDGTIDWSRADGRPALVFSGDYGLVRIPDHPRLRFRRNESFTLMVWVKPPEELVNGAWQGVVTKPRGRQDGWYGIWLGNFNGERRWVYGSTFRGDNMANLVGSRVVDGWQHVCIVQNHAQRTRRIYVDGLDVCVDGRPGPAKDSDGVGDLLIGGATILTRENTEVVEQFRGSIAEVRLYSRALTPEEILKAAQER